MIHETANISPLAHVDPQAQIGANVEVAPFAFIGPNVTVGAGAWIGPHATVLGDTTIGEECKLFPRLRDWGGLSRPQIQRRTHHRGNRGAHEHP